MTVQQCVCGAVIDHEECACSLQDTDCVTIDGSGSVLNPFRPELVVDTDENNIMTCESDGVLVKLPTWMTAPDRCQVFHSANQSIPTGNEEQLAFDSENYDTGTPRMHDAATDNHRISIRTAGIYIITFVCAWAANSSGYRSIVLRNNGQSIAAVQRDAASSAFETGMNITTHRWLEPGDDISVSVKQGSGVSLNLIGGTTYSPILTVQFRRLPPE